MNNTIIIYGGLYQISQADNSFFIGKVGFGTKSPTGKIHIASGGTSSNSAPLKFTSGSLLTTPETGAVEFDGYHFYGSVGSSRYQLDNGLTVTGVSNNYSIISGDTGKYFTNEGATTGITFTLPTAVKNLNYTFIAENSNQINVTAGSSSTISVGLNISTSGGSISTTDSGSSITLVAINSTKWIATSVVGTWIV